MEVLSVCSRICFSINNPMRIISRKDISSAKLPCKTVSFPISPSPTRVKCPTGRSFSLSTSKRNKHYASDTPAVTTDAESDELTSQFEGFSVTVARDYNTEPRELKLTVEVSGEKTRSIFEDVFSKMVAAAQPIPGFRRVKGGKTPNIPRDILLEVLGPSRVYGQVIGKIINTTVAEYIGKEGLKVYKDLAVEQSFSDLEAAFEPGEEFRFDAVIRPADRN